MKLIDFYADWCGPCKMLSPILEKVANERNMELIKINIEEDSDGMTANYGVRGIPTVIVLDENDEIGRFTGAKSEGDLNTFFDSLKK